MTPAWPASRLVIDFLAVCSVLAAPARLLDAPQTTPAPSQPSVEHLVDMVFELDTWPELLQDPDNSEGGWTRLIETAQYFQRLDPKLVQAAVSEFTAKYGTLHEGGLDGIEESSKVIPLSRTMFEIPEDMLVPEEYPPEPLGYGGYMYVCPALEGVDSVWQTLAMPMKWTDQGPMLICEMRGYKGFLPARVDEEYKYFREHFKLRNGLERHLRSLEQDRPALNGPFVQAYRKFGDRSVDPELEYEFSKNDGAGYEELAASGHYRNFAPIHVAARRGDVAVLRRQLANGVPVDLRVKNKGGYGWWRETTPLMWAALEGNADSVRLLLESQADLNASNDAGTTPLMFAAAAENGGGKDPLARMMLLLKAGAKISATDNEGKTAIEYLSGSGITESRGDVSRLRALLQAGADINARNTEGGTPFIDMASHADPSLMRVLIAAGGDVSATTETGWNALLCAAGYNEPKVVQMLVDAGSDLQLRSTNCGPQTVLMWAARSERGAGEKIRVLLKAGVKVNEDDGEGWTAIMSAASAGDEQAVRALIDGGADVRAKSSDGFTALTASTEQASVTPSWMRAHGYCPAVVQMLIKAGCDPTVVTANGRTALMGAAKAGDVEGVRALIVAGAQTTPADGDGRTALTEAAASPRADRRIIELLVKAGAEVDRADHKGMTALMYAAAESRSPSSVQALLEAGARRDIKNREGKTVLDLIQQLRTARVLRISRALRDRR